MKYLITFVLILFTLPALGQVQQVTHSSIEMVLPHDEHIEYSRDMVESVDELWAMDDVQLAFFLSEIDGAEVEIPTFMADTIRATVDSLYQAMEEATVLVNNLEQTVIQHEQTITNLQAENQDLMESVEPLEEALQFQTIRADSLQAEQDYAVQRMRDAMDLFLDRPGSDPE